MSVTGVIITLNEAPYIGEALGSLAWCDELLVVDSGSTDGTQAIAREAGARVVEWAFQTHAEQYNHAFALTTTPWIFLLDADERCSLELQRECRRMMQSDSSCCFRVPRMNQFFGRWVRHGAQWPDYCVRLFRAHHRYEERASHAHISPCPRRRSLRSPILHYAYRDMSQYQAKLNSYTTLMAVDRIRIEGNQSAKRVRMRDSFKYWLRDRTMTWPGRPMLRFIYDYVLRRGFMDGRVGFRLAVLAASNEYIASLKAEEIRARTVDPKD